MAGGVALWEDPPDADAPSSLGPWALIGRQDTSRKRMGWAGPPEGIDTVRLLPYQKPLFQCIHEPSVIWQAICCPILNLSDCVLLPSRDRSTFVRYLDSTETSDGEAWGR